MSASHPGKRHSGPALNGSNADVARYAEMRNDNAMKSAASVVMVLLVLGGCYQKHRTYHIECATPPRGFGTAKDGIGELRPYVVIAISPSGTISWAGKSVSYDQLSHYLRVSGELLPVPQLVLDPAAMAPCREVERVRALMIESKTCSGEVPLCSEGHDPRHWPIPGADNAPP